MSDNHSFRRPDSEDEEVLVFETSPYGTIDAIVQQDGRCIYFYLNGSSQPVNNSFGTRACWVRNLQAGPYILNQDEARSGIPPMLPRTHCRPLEAGRLPNHDELKIVWFEEGNGAALQEFSQQSNSFETLAVIPPWSGFDGFHGYAFECVAESPVCWPLPTNPQLKKRIENAEEFWQAFSKPPDPFSDLQTKILNAYRSLFLSETKADPVEKNYFAIDGGKFPPRGLAHYQTGNLQFLFTVAMSLCPQPMVELNTDQPSSFRRIELALELGPDCDEALIGKAGQAVSSLAAYPWQNFNWFGHGHTAQFQNVIPGKDAVLFVNDAALKKIDCVQMPVFRGDPVQLLWLIPLSTGQMNQLRKQTITVDDFLAQLTSDAG